MARDGKIAGRLGAAAFKGGGGAATIGRVTNFLRSGKGPTANFLKAGKGGAINPGRKAAGRGKGGGAGGKE